MACASVSAKITGSLSTIRCAARAAAAVSAVRLGSPLAITRARLQPITSIIAQNNLYNNGHTITLKRQCAPAEFHRAVTSCAQVALTRPFPVASRAPRWTIGAHTTAPMDHRGGCLLRGRPTLGTDRSELVTA